MKETPFPAEVTYTLSHVLKGIRRLPETVTGWQEVSSSPDQIVRDLAKQALPGYEAALRYVESKTPKQIYDDLVQVHAFYRQLSEVGTNPVEIARQIIARFDNIPLHLNDIVDPIAGGWIHTLKQHIWVAAIEDAPRG